MFVLQATTLFFLTVLCFTICLALPAVNIATTHHAGVHIPFRQVRTGGDQVLSGRDVLVSLANNERAYLIDLAIGSPPQNVQLVLDTGSSEVFVLSSAACPNCASGSYTPASSRTSYDVANLGVFTGTFGGGIIVIGTYYGDKAQLGAAEMTDVQFVTAITTNSLYGAMGIGLGSSNKHPGILKTLLDENIISSNSYSIFLDSVTASTGSIIFGGIDSSKYLGELVSLPIIPKARPDDIDRLNVEWTYLALTDESITHAAPEFSTPVLLDTGSTLTTMPTTIFEQLYEYFGASGPYDGVSYVNCDMPAGYLSYGFGTGPAVMINVSFSELAIPTDDPNKCIFGLQAQNGSGITFGDTFIRGAYLNFDFDKMEVGLAQRY